MLNHDVFLRHIAGSDYILIKLTDEWPYFVEKVFVKDGVSRTETNYHIADGMYSTYINYEMPDNGISAEISGPISFEVCGHYDCSVYVMNCGNEAKKIKVSTYNTSTWPLEPGEAAAIYPECKVQVEEDMFQEEELWKTHPEKFLTQEEITALLRGIPIKNASEE